MQRKAETPVTSLLSSSAAPVRKLAATALSLFWTTDKKLRVTSTQGTGLLRLSLLPEDLRGISLDEYLGSQGAYEPLLLAHREALEGQSSSFEMVWMGQVVQVKIEPMRDDRGEITGVIGVALELIERKRSEEERQAIFEIIHGINVTANLDELLRLIHQSLQRIVYAENCFVALYEQRTGMFHFPFFVDQYDTAPPPVKAGKSCTAYVFRTGRPMIIRQDTFDELAAQEEVELVGTPSPTWLGVPLRTPTETIGVLVVQHYEDANAYTERDLEFLSSVGGQIALAIARKRTEDDLRKQQEEQQIIFDSAPLMIWYKDTENRILRANRAAAESVGLKVNAVEGLSTYDLYPEEAAKYHQDDLEVIKTGSPKLGIIEPYQTASGEKRWARTDKIPYRDQEGNIIGVLVFASDITERKQAEEALQRSEANYRSLIEGAPYGIFRTSTDGRLFSANPALVEMLGYGSLSEMLGANLDRDIFCDPMQRKGICREHPNGFEGVEVGWKRRDSTPITVRVSGKPVRDAAGQASCYEMIAENITDRRFLEQQLRQAQKMEAVGRLAGGVAHDFNNLLMVILGHTGLLLEREDVDEWVHRKAEQVQKAADRAAGLTRQLLAFSRMQVLQPKVIDLNGIVSEMAKLLPRLIGENIELLVRLDPVLGPVKADPGQMEQVILNLAVNARDAMPEGGKLVIETSDAELDEAYARRHPPLQAGSYVLLAVTDTGIGMDVDTQALIFEPFFTTKERGKGTGLGLATVYGVVKQSGGYIWVYSEVGKGTTFKIYFPLVREPLDSRLSMEPSQAPAGTETILLVEDEGEVREVAREFLGLSGYAVIEAKDGAEAIELARKHSGPIHLLITDMVMPGIGGRELVKQLSQERGELRIIFMSGYTEYAVLQQGELERGAVLLPKPFTREVLARTVREVLEGKKTA